MAGRFGAVAQLGERLVRNEEASGSIPLSSTIPLVYFWGDTEPDPMIPTSRDVPAFPWNRAAVKTTA